MKPAAEHITTATADETASDDFIGYSALPAPHNLSSVRTSHDQTQWLKSSWTKLGTWSTVRLFVSLRRPHNHDHGEKQSNMVSNPQDFKGQQLAELLTTVVLSAVGVSLIQTSPLCVVFPAALQRVARLTYSISLA